MPTALLTGATGFVGSHLFDRLVERGWRVRCTLRKSSDRRWLEGKPFQPVEGDLVAGTGLVRAMEGADAVFHVAGVIAAPNLAAYRAGNVMASQNVAEAATVARVKRLVHVSTLAVAGPSADGTPIDEAKPCAPISIYGKTKLEGEREVWKRRDLVGVTIVRPPVVYGPRDRGLFDLYKVLAGGIRPSIGGPKHLSLVHVADLVEGLVRAGEGPRAIGEIFYLSDERPRRYLEVMGMILEALGRRAVTVPLPDRALRFLGAVAERVLPLAGRAGMFSYDKALEMTQKHWVCTPAKAGRLLGWAARVPLDRGLRETLEWYVREGWLRR